MGQSVKYPLIRKKEKPMAIVVDNHGTLMEIDPEKLPPYEVYTPSGYSDGPEGFIKWCNEKVHIPIYPPGSDIALWCGMGELPTGVNSATGRSYRQFWEDQQEVIRCCLRMVDNRFIYRLIIFCWMRGDGKSLLACLVQLWKFFNWTKQNIVLGANSKEQITFVHFDIMKDIILNSPELLKVVGKKNIQDKKIILRDDRGNISSTIRAISSFSGIVSNITGYTFSEIFDMKNPRFFVQLDGSIRNIPNALGVIDSTVSTKQHVLYQMYKSFMDGKTKTLYFSYRCSPKADHNDFWNPNMDQKQLEDYKTKFPMGDFERYFQNTWESAVEKVFTDEMIEEMNYIGVDGQLNHGAVKAVVKNMVYQEKAIAYMHNRTQETGDVSEHLAKMRAMKARLMSIDDHFTYHDNIFKLPDLYTIDRLTDVYDTNWSLLAGIDRADPLKESKQGARTIVTFVLKGLMGSKSNPSFYNPQAGVPSYLYILLYVGMINDHTLEGIKTVLLSGHEDLGGLDMICGERWGIWDLVPWCEEKDIKLEAVHPSYSKQKSAFTELHTAVKTGRFKAPKIPVWGYKEGDVLREEFRKFNHDIVKKWFGSTEKFEKGGVQDDVIFSTAWGIYGGREIGADSFKERVVVPYFGTFVREKAPSQAW